MKDHAGERNCRHLDAMQFQAILTARGCCSGERSGLKTIAVPLAQQHIRFTLLFEGCVIGVLQESQSI